MAWQQFDDFALPDDGELVAVEVEGTAVAVAVLDGEVRAFDFDRAHREQLGQQWVAFHSDHQQAQGLTGRDTDPHSMTEHR